MMLFSGVSCHSAREVFCFLYDAVFGCRLLQCQESFCFDVMLFWVLAVTVPERLLVFYILLFSGVSCHGAREVFCF